MTANLNPVFTLNPNVGTGALATAEASLTAPSTVVTILTAGANGTMLERVTVHGTATSAAALVRLFLYDGAAYHLFEELVVPVAVVSTTVAAFDIASSKITPATPLVLPSGWSLRATITVSQTAQVIAEGGDF